MADVATQEAAEASSRESAMDVEARKEDTAATTLAEAVAVPEAVAGLGGKITISHSAIVMPQSISSLTGSFLRRLTSTVLLS